MNITIAIEGTDPRKAAKAGTFWLEFQQACGECGCCGSKNTIFTHRKNGDYDFYEAACSDCGARHPFGTKKDGVTLFPKRDKGWAKYQKQDGGGNAGSNAPDDDGSPPF